MVKAEKELIGACEREVLVHARRKDGVSRLVFRHHNVITYSAADAMARMTGGDAQYIPSKIGFVYAPTGVPGGIANPGTDRNQLWASISATLKVPATMGNIILCPLITPAFSVYGDPAYYSGNVVAVTSMTDKAAPLAFSGVDYDLNPPTAGVHDYFQAWLLSVVYTPGNPVPTYVPFAVVQLAAVNAGQPVAAFEELVITWPIGYK